MQNLLYQFLQLTTIENADLQSYSTGDTTKSLDEIDQKQRNLNTLSECMSYLFTEIAQKQDRAIPLALAESTLKAAKGLSLGSFLKAEAQEKEAGVYCYPISLSEVLSKEDQG